MENVIGKYVDNIMLNIMFNIIRCISFRIFAANE